MCRQPIAENSYIVVAMVGEEATVKRLSIEGEHIELCVGAAHYYFGNSLQRRSGRKIIRCQACSLGKEICNSSYVKDKFSLKKRLAANF